MRRRSLFKKVGLLKNFLVIFTNYLSFPFKFRLLQILAQEALIDHNFWKEWARKSLKVSADF